MQNDYISREEKMEEYISREHLLKEIKAFLEKDKWKKYRTLRERRERKRYTQIFEIGVKHFPAADVRPVVHGKWTLKRDGSGTCNECGMTQKNVWDDDMHQRYCGCCGARMDGE